MIYNNARLVHFVRTEQMKAALFNVIHIELYGYTTSYRDYRDRK